MASALPARAPAYASASAAVGRDWSARDEESSERWSEPGRCAAGVALVGCVRREPGASGSRTEQPEPPGGSIVASASRKGLLVGGRLAAAPSPSRGSPVEDAAPHPGRQSLPHGRGRGGAPGPRILGEGPIHPL